MNLDDTTIKVLAGTIPVLGALVGWLLLWRRNVIVVHQKQIHFCGQDVLSGGYFPGKRKVFPQVNATELTFFNFGVKHLDKIEFETVGISTEAIFHPSHTNGLPDSSFSFDDSGRQLKCTITEIPAFERFSIAVLDTNSGDDINPKGSAKSYVFKSSKRYYKRLAIFVVVTFVLFVALYFFVW